MKKKIILSCIVCIALVALLWVHPAFAADTSTAPTDIPGFNDILNLFLKFLSRGWMICAFLAGKLMSNALVYGSFIHLDTALFTMWNYMKNIANFTLGFVLLWAILQFIFDVGGKWGVKPQSIITKLLIAGVLIQSSRFIMGALVDLGTIATAAVGAFPAQFIQGAVGDSSKTAFNNIAATIPTRIDISFSKDQPLFTYAGSQTIDSIISQFNDMSWPLLFIGEGIMRFQNYDILNQDVTSFKNFSIALFLKVLLLLAFTVPMIVLIIINLIRLFRLRLWIVFSPLAAISWAFGDKDTPGMIKSAWEKLWFNKLSDIIKLIFQPVAMVGSLGLILILTVGMYYVMGGNPGDLQQNGSFSKTIDQVEISANAGTSSFKDLVSGTQVSVTGDLFSDMGNFVGGMIGYLIMAGFTIMLIWSLVQMSGSFSKFTAKTADSIFKFAEGAVKTVPIIPLGGKMLSLGGLEQAGKDTMAGGNSYFNKVEGKQGEGLADSFYDTWFGKAYQKAAGTSHADAKSQDISKSQTADLEKLIDTAPDLREFAAGLRSFSKQASASGQTLSLQSTNFMGALSKVLSTKTKSSLLQFAGLDKNEKDVAFNSANSKNKQLVAGVMYLMNNDYNEATDQNREAVKERVEKNTLKESIDAINNNTSLVVSTKTK